jgi:hypothetical protein
VRQNLSPEQLIEILSKAIVLVLSLTTPPRCWTRFSRPEDSRKSHKLKKELEQAI